MLEDPPYIPPKGGTGDNLEDIIKRLITEARDINMQIHYNGVSIEQFEAGEEKIKALRIEAERLRRIIDKTKKPAGFRPHESTNKMKEL